MNILNGGIRETETVFSEAQILSLREDLFSFIPTISEYPDTFSDKGIVTCAGKVDYFTCSWVLIKMLRQLNCTLPIELWFQEDELIPEIVDSLKQYDVKCCKFEDYHITATSGYALKPIAIALSSFSEVLYLDADNNCLQDPTYLFSSPEYKKFGSIFWPDFWKTPNTNQIWDITGCDVTQNQELESGQLLINKKVCWRALQLCIYFNHHGDQYYKLLLGDKDTFKFAWNILNIPFFLIQKPVGSLGYLENDSLFRGVSMVQHDTNHNILFLHRNLLKWDISEPSERVWHVIKQPRTFHALTECTLDIAASRHTFLDLKGDIEIICFSKMHETYEEDCQKHLTSLRNSELYHKFLLYAYFRFFRYGFKKPNAL